MVWPQPKCVCVFECVKAQGNVGWLAAWWLSLLLSVLNVIFPLAVQGPSVCWACCSLCGDQRDPQNSQHTEEVTQPDLTQLSRVCWSSLRPLRTRQTGPDGTRLSRVHHCFSSETLCPSSLWSVDGFIYWLKEGYSVEQGFPTSPQNINKFRKCMHLMLLTSGKKFLLTLNVECSWRSFIAVLTPRWTWF